MFTIEQIRLAHAKVTSGADFPRYISDLRSLGVLWYETFVSDGHVDYKGMDSLQLSSPAKYETLVVASETDKELFMQELRIHQQGKTDYMHFCTVSAKSGVNKWVVDVVGLTCTYYDLSGNEVLQEQIPSV